MNIKDSVIIIPTNDSEAVMILKIAEKMGLSIITSKQPHGASIDRIEGLVEQIKEGGWKNVVIVEMPGEKTEREIRGIGEEREMKLYIIDHHHYTGLDRAHDPKTGEQLPASLEQFLGLFQITDEQLKAWDFDPKMVKSVGIMDRGYVWAMLKEGYSWADADKTFDYCDELMAYFKNMSDESAKLAYAKKLWETAKDWNGFFIVEDDSEMSLRRRLSKIVALDRKKPTSLIINEKGRGFIYVQESDRAMDLFEKFGGFTFGEHQNWGYKNEPDKPEVTLEDVQNFLATI